MPADHIVDVVAVGHGFMAAGRALRMVFRIKRRTHAQA